MAEPGVSEKTTGLSLANPNKKHNCHKETHSETFDLRFHATAPLKANAFPVLSLVALCSIEAFTADKVYRIIFDGVRKRKMGRK